MTLATADAQGKPSARTVLLKGIDDRGFRFFTSKTSRKGCDLEENPHASLVFYWHDLERQVRIDGKVEDVPPEESALYYESRPRGSQLAARIELQSRVVPDRAFLEREFQRIESEFADGRVSPPESWGGYLVVPSMFEFWQGRPSRLHDRIRYRKDQDEWIIERLGP